MLFRSYLNGRVCNLVIAFYLKISKPLLRLFVLISEPQTALDSQHPPYSFYSSLYLISYFLSFLFSFPHLFALLFLSHFRASRSSRSSHVALKSRSPGQDFPGFYRRNCLISNYWITYSYILQGERIMIEPRSPRDLFSFLNKFNLPLIDLYHANTYA